MSGNKEEREDWSKLADPLNHLESVLENNNNNKNAD